MSGITLLLALLALAFLGSALVGGRSGRGFGSASGAEYLLLGFLLGPHALGVVERQSVAAFEPLALVAVGWIALIVGLEPLSRDGASPSHSAIVIGVLFAAGAGAAAWGGLFSSFRAGILRADAHELEFALAAGCAAASTTRHALRAAVERHGARGPLTELLGQAATAGQAVPLLGMSALFALAPASVELTVPWRVAITLGLGASLGLVVAALLRREARRDESWTLLIGTALLGIGIAVRLGLSALTVTFVMGWCLRLASRQASALHTLLAPTEHAVLLPLMLLAGVSLDLAAAPLLPLIVVLVLLCRTLAMTLLGALFTGVSPLLRKGGRLAGVAMLPAGAVTVAVGISCAVRLPGAVGQTILCVSAAAALFGELLGPGALFASLRRAGEIEEPSLPPAAEIEPT